MTRFGLIRKSTGSWLTAVVLTKLFEWNERFIRSRELRESIWVLLKAELFYVGGKCQKSGHCCQRILIYHHQAPITSLAKWRERVKALPKSLARFIPVTRHGKIQYFSCSCLTADNTCSAYSTRPNFCKAYPFSNFMIEAPLYEKCGFKVARTQLRLKIQNLRLRRLVRRMELIYNLN